MTEVKQTSMRIKGQRQHGFRTAACRGWALFALLALQILLGEASAIPFGRDQSGIWYDPLRSGEGWVVEVLEGEIVVLTWFTYDSDGRPRWMYGLSESPTEGTDVRSFELFAPSGGRFTTPFAPSSVSHTMVGHAEVGFTSCEAGTVEFTVEGHELTVPIQRIAKTMGASCASPRGLPGELVRPHLSQSGSWYETERSGEGFQLVWSTTNDALLMWYTFDDDGLPYWIIGSGALDNGVISFPQLYSASGAQFGGAFDPNDVLLVEWGSLTLTLECLGGTAQYSSLLPEFGDGTRDLSRLTFSVDTECPWTPPTPAELFDWQVTELPFRANDPTSGPLDSILAESIANDGTVVGALRRSLPRSRKGVLWRPGDSLFSLLPERLLDEDPILISGDGLRVVANEPNPEDISEPVEALTLTLGEDWTTLPNPLFHRSYVEGASSDLNWIVGRGKQFGDPSFDPWIWNIETGKVMLRGGEGFPSLTPLHPSEDGTSTVGYALAPHPSGFILGRAIRWRGDAEPELLRDSDDNLLSVATTCNADCSVIFGSGAFDTPADPDLVGQSWYWINPNRFAYLGRLPDGPLGYSIQSASLDGSIVTGVYGMANSQGALSARGFIWTPNSGLSPIEATFAHDGQPWNLRTVLSARISPNGRWVLVAGLGDSDGTTSTQHYAIELIPKSSSAQE